jgi:DNA-binding FrmR family transcriptional regulator
MQVKDVETRQDLTKRLRRIEGQVRGVGKMLDDERNCHEVLQQLAAIRSAVQQVSLVVARDYACQCLEASGAGKSRQEIVDDLIGVLSKTA